MRQTFLLCVIVLAGAQPAGAQGTDPLRRPALGTFDVVALRVEFQPDTSRFTTGTGTFEGDLFEDLTPTIDPLPHDAPYFEAHLEFLRSYVQHVSDGAATVRTHLLPEVVRVSKRMGEYAPTGPEADEPAQRARLAALIEEAWTLADEQMAFDAAGLNPERTAFVIFHAGVGRDVELTGTILDRTPEDLPSLFFGPETLQELLPSADISFGGMPVAHSLIIPRTESRRGVDFITDEPFLVEISINGMLAASFFNYLGVPDLFDTESGRSAIGPFGLMDPLGIFAYSGLFPPEPSAWTRYFLGWVDPIEVRGPDAMDISLVASSLQGTRDVARVWISESEYFLVENRQRHAVADEVSLTVWQPENPRQTITFSDGTEGFNAQDVSAFPGGVVVAADNYDWALPGGLDEEGNALRGGILIWHIDERVIRARLAANAVNADPGRRAIDLEEADSAQDLGFPSENPFAPQADLGSPFDFWYQGNPIRVIGQIGQEIALYRNRFGPDTFPSSDAADGGESFVVLEEFSPTGVEMRFVYRRASGERTHPLDVPFADALHAVVDSAGSAATASVWETGGLVVADIQMSDGTWLIGIGGPDGTVATFEAMTPATVLGEALVWVGRDVEGLRFVRYHVAAGSVDSIPIPGSAGARVAGVLVSTGENVHVLSDVAGTATLFATDGSTVSTVEVPEIGIPIGLTAYPGGTGLLSVVAYGRAGAVAVSEDQTWTYGLSPDEEVGRPVTGVDANGFMGVIPLVDRGTLLVLEAEGAVDEIDAVTQSTGEVVLAEVTGDSQLEIIVSGDSLLYAYARSGAIAAGFPIHLSARSGEAPAVARSSAGPVLFVPLVSGAIDAYERDVRGQFTRLAGYPLALGTEALSLSIGESTEVPGASVIYGFSASGRLRAWRQEDVQDVLWAGPFAGSFRSSTAFVSATDVPDGSSNLLVADETYNWPNPIRDGRTFIRCMTRDDSDVHVTIVDGAGLLVGELELESVRAGVPTEIAWETNASSGLYFARVTATSVTGREDTRVIKMAVIR